MKRKFRLYTVIIALGVAVSAGADVKLPSLLSDHVVLQADRMNGYLALAHFFSRELRRELKRPVNAINPSVGATPIQNWWRSGLAGPKPRGPIS